MVKNKKGGKSHKKLARKNVRPAYMTRKLRAVKEEGEMYARIMGMSGGGHATILCSDKKERTLVIRGKFRGRNKRDNTVKVNSIVLVALRSISMGEVVRPGKKEKADLIYVYNDGNIEELKKIKEIYDILSDQIKNEEVEDNIIFTNKVIDDIEVSKKKEEEKEFTLKDVEIDWDEI